MKYLDDLKQYDPEFCEFFDNFANDQVINTIALDDKTRAMAIMAVLLGSSNVELFVDMTDEFLKGVTPVEYKEVMYQAVAYLGIGKVYPFLKAVNPKLEALGITLPLEGQSTTNKENRREKGTAKQMELFGDNYADFYKKGTIQLWLAGNCFGDYYTRTGLDNKQREMITFCFLSGQQSMPQLEAHIAANIGVGNSAEFLNSVALNNMPYIGYPRTLNTLGAIGKVASK